MFSRRSHSDALVEALGRAMVCYELSMDGMVQEANERFKQVFGLSDTDLRGLSHRALAGPGQASGKAYAGFWAALKRGEPQVGEVRRFALDGREVWLQAAYTPVPDRHGQPARVVVFASDVTERKLHAVDVQGRLDAINRSQAVITFDLDGTILDANDNFLRMMKYDLEDLQGWPHQIFMAPEDLADGTYDAFWGALLEGRFQSAEYRRLGKDNQEVWVLATYDPVLDVDGNIVKIVEYATDITEEKRKHADYESQIAAIDRSQAVISFDLDGTILDANGNFLAAMGYRLQEVKGRHHRMFVEEAYADTPEYAAFWERLRRGEHFSAVFQRYAKGGRAVWIQATYNPILDAKGRPVKVVKYATDITQSMTARSVAITASERTLVNVQSVSASAEELSASIGEISAHMLRTMGAVDDIHGRALASGTSTQRLSDAAQAMDGVVRLIAQISKQINLLALNANIEAARAGEAGRGFAVVANEVKALATQAGQAAAGISDEIAKMQGASNEVIGAFGSISQAIASVQGIVSEVNGAVQEQNRATQEITSNVHTAFQGVVNISRSLDDWVVGLEERRRAERTRTYLPALVTAIGRREPIECVVRDISHTGARLELPNAASLPDAFVLRISGEHGDKNCLIARRGEGMVGVKFI